MRITNHSEHASALLRRECLRASVLAMNVKLQDAIGANELLLTQDLLKRLKALTEEQIWLARSIRGWERDRHFPPVAVVGECREMGVDERDQT